MRVRLGWAPLALLVGSVLGAACDDVNPGGTVDLGDNFVPPEILLDEDFFYCQIQPNVIARQTCASGAAGEAGECHSTRSALRLATAGESDPPPACTPEPDNTATGPVPMSYSMNYQAVQFTVQSDPMSSPFYRRPLNIDSHPREIFNASSPEADLIVRWISGSL